MRRKRSGKSPLRPRSVWLKTAQVAEVRAASDAADVRKQPVQVGLPYRLLGGLRCEQHDTFALVKDEPLDQHQADEGLAETHAVAEERAAVLPGDLHERPVRLLLVAIEVREHARPCLVPLGRGQLVPAEELLQGPSRRRRMAYTGAYGGRSSRRRRR